MKERRKTGKSQPDKEKEHQFFDELSEAFTYLPRFVSRKLTERVISAYQIKGYEGACIKFHEITRRDLPVIVGTHHEYSIKPNELPGYLFGGLASDDALGAIRSMSYRFNVLPDGEEEDIQLLAQDLARYLRVEMEYLSSTLDSEDVEAAAGAIYSMAAGVAEHFHMTPPEWKRFINRKATLQQLVIAISQMMSERYWLRNLRHYTRRWQEHLYIALGGVRRQSSPYCSQGWVQRWLASRNSGRQIMKETNVIDEDTGEEVDLLTLVDNSISNVEKRRAELITRVKGLEQLAQFDGVAQEQGYKGLFFTWTAPGRYHPWLASGHRNRKWNGASPRKTQQYFTRTWKQLNSALKRAGVHIFGLRISQPHHDGTPHWHGMLFVHEEQADKLLQIFRYYADREDSDELTRYRATGKNTHLDITSIDESKGSVTAYITRHIGMNIEGCASGGLDKETGQPYTVLARNASAWASLWGIKQFQFVGSSPVSVWRELRRFNDQKKADDIAPIFGEMHRAADKGDWAAYVRLQGGPFITRKSLTIRPWYKRSEEPDECGQFSAIIKGVYLPGTDKAPVATRIRKWKVRSPQQNAKPGSLKINRKSALTPWTCVNNCIMRRKQPADRPQDLHLKIPIQLELDFGEMKKASVSER